MSTVIRVLETALPVFLTLAIGMLCRSKNILSREGVNALKRVAVDIALPAELFHAFATADYSGRSIAVPAIMYLICCAALALGFIGAKLFKQSKLTPFLMTGFEAGMLGYALFTLLFKDEPSAKFAIIDLGQVLFVFTIYKAMLCGKGGIRSAVEQAVKSPVLWAIIVGILFGATGLYEALRPSQVSNILDSCAGFIAAPTSCAILISIGYDLVLREIRWKQTAVIVAMRIVIMGALLALTAFLNNLVLGGIMHTGALILMFILPPPYVLPVFADAGEERANISSALSVLTLISIALFAVLSAVM